MVSEAFAAKNLLDRDDQHIRLGKQIEKLVASADQAHGLILG